MVRRIIGIGDQGHDGSKLVCVCVGGGGGGIFSCNYLSVIIYPSFWYCCCK